MPLSTPLPEPPKCRKQPACLVKGIHTNMVATQLPLEATFPLSLPTITTTINTFLQKEKANVQIKEILKGVQCHITVVLLKTTDDVTGQLALHEVLKAFSTKPGDTHILEQHLAKGQKTGLQRPPHPYQVVLAS